MTIENIVNVILQGKDERQISGLLEGHVLILVGVK